MKAAAGFLMGLMLVGCAAQQQEPIFPPDQSADAAACREEAQRDPALQRIRHSVNVEYNSQMQRVQEQLVHAQRRSYFDCMALRGHGRRGGVERVRR